MKSMLAIGLTVEDRDRAQEILAPRGWGIREIAGYFALPEQLRRHRFAAVLCESELIDGSWRDVLEELTAQAPAPPLIVTSFLADASLWAEVLNRGGFDVVRVPFEVEELARVAALAAEGNPLTTDGGSAPSREVTQQFLFLSGTVERRAPIASEPRRFPPPSLRQKRLDLLAFGVVLRQLLGDQVTRRGAIVERPQTVLNLAQPAQEAIQRGAEARAEQLQCVPERFCLQPEVVHRRR